ATLPEQDSPFDALSKAIEDKNVEMEMIEQETKSLIKLKCDIEAEVDKAKKDLAEAQEEKRQALADIPMAQREAIRSRVAAKEKLAKETQNLIDTKAQLEKDIEDHRAKLAEEEAETDAAWNTIENSRQTTLTWIQEQETAVQNLEERKAKLDDECDDLDAEKKQLEQEKDDLMKQIDEKRNPTLGNPPQEKLELEQENSKLATDIAEKKETLKKLQEDINRAEIMLEELEGKRKVAQEAVDEVLASAPFSGRTPADLAFNGGRGDTQSLMGATSDGGSVQGKAAPLSALEQARAMLNMQSGSMRQKLTETGASNGSASFPRTSSSSGASAVPGAPSPAQRDSLADQTPDKVSEVMQNLAHITDGIDKSTLVKPAAEEKGVVEWASATPRHERGDMELKAYQDSNFKNPFEMRSALGNRLSRQLQNPTTDSQKEFKKRWDLATNKDALKTEWAEKQIQGLIEEKKVTTRETEDELTSRGKPVTFLRMLYEVGGPAGQTDPETIAGCSLACQQCLEMGWPCVQLDDKTNIVKYMHFENEYKEAFRTRYSLIKEQSDRAPPTAPSVGGGGGDLPRPDPPKPRPTPQPKPESSQALQTASKHVKEVKMVLSSAQAILTTIDNETDWAWAKTPDVRGSISALLDSLSAGLNNNKLGTMLMRGMDNAKVSKLFDSADMITLSANLLSTTKDAFEGR
ncbi:unnamed protein product, partial [Prorocentrum cordatum]